MHFGYLLTAYRQSYGDGYRQRDAMDGNQFFQQVLGRVKQARKGLVTNMGGYVHDIDSNVSDNIFTIRNNGGLYGFGIVRSNPGIDIWGPVVDDPFVKKVFTDMSKAAKKNGLRFERHPCNYRGMVSNLRELVKVK